MATFSFSATSIPFTASDKLTFASGISAASLTITASGGDLTITSGATSMTLQNFSLEFIAVTNFIFADGSKLIIGDGGTAGVADSNANLLTGGALNDYLDGRDGDDTLIGGDGDDKLIGGANSTLGDTASYATAVSAVAVNLSTITAQDTGGAGIDTLVGAGTVSQIENLIGSAYGDTLTGSSVANKLDGGLGNDVLIGGGGDDTYVVTAGDLVTEVAAGGTDKILSSVDYTLPVEVENLTLTAGTQGTGNSVANIIVGNSSANVINGLGGIDTMQGLTGNDTYIVDNTGDIVTEAALGGTDLVLSSATYTLSSEVENLRLMGSAAINGTGNALDNTFYASTGLNQFDGLANTAANSTTTAIEGDTVSYLYGATSGVVANLTTNVASGGSGADTFAGIENLIGSNYGDNLNGGTTANYIAGGLGNDTLAGGTGIDTLEGGLGDDRYNVDTVTDVINEGSSQGTDLVSSSVNYTLVDLDVENLTLTGTAAIGTGNASNNALTGNASANTLDGGAGSDTIDGGAGADTMTGRAGNDVYTVDNLADSVSELSATSTDATGTDTVNSSVTFTLPTFVENLTLTATAANGTGNALANTLVGNASANILDGAAGIDKMSGGAGNDSYLVDNKSDAIIELVAQGTDDIQVSVVGLTTPYALGNNVENLTFTATATPSGTVTPNLTGYGNELANTLTGNALANVFDGKAGADTMIGLGGNDVYYVDNSSDIVTEGAAAGTDSVYSTVTRTLEVNVDNLTLLSAAGNGTGNTDANTITGNSIANTLSGLAGVDVLNGMAGKDILIGGAGDDKFVFTLASHTSTSAFDVISDFTTGVAALGDKIDVSALNNGTTAITYTFLAGSGTAFTGTAGVAGAAEIRFVASTDNTMIYGDANGDNTADWAVQLLGVTSVIATDFVL